MELCAHSYLVGDGLEQVIMPVGNVTCNGFVRSMLLSLLNDQFSASSVKSSQLWLICMAVCTSRSWVTSRTLTSAHSSCRSCDTRGVSRGKGPGLVANGLNPVEYRLGRGANMLKVGVGDASLLVGSQSFVRFFWWKWRAQMWCGTYLDRDVVDVIVTELVAALRAFVGISRVGEAGVLLAPGRLMIGVLLHRFKLFVGSKSIVSCSAAKKWKFKYGAN